MARKASRVLHVGYYHKPADGKTPVFDTASKKWTYHTAPTEAQLTASIGQFNALETKTDSAYSKSETAFTKAEAADFKAVEAKATADTKVTAAEAVDEVKEQMFEVTPYSAGGFRNPTKTYTIEFVEENPSRWQIFVNLSGSDPNSPTSVSRGWLDYVDNDSFNAVVESIEERLAAIEKKLGIS